jgi:hypothetical protein
MANETIEAQLAEALKTRLAVIGNQSLRAADPERHLAELREASERIAALDAELPATAHPQLRHYLDRCSYDKALAWLEQDGLTGSKK